MKNKGYFILEGIVVLGIFTTILTVSFSIFSNSMKIKNNLLNISNIEINYRRNIDYMLKEIKNGKELNLDTDRLKFRKNIIENNISKEIEITYYFSGTSLLRKASNSEKYESFLENIKGEFSFKENLLNLLLKFKDREEEYVVYIQ
ncbi:MAG: hypothetical protein MR673_09370 [Fusobacterium perfoetens]|uniref:hypothetical protein n=1 Tax=Fusobacterium perfoetens TaxID=852 RepID=UPI0023F05738|nr:hypothetical protein [Fusobacterium perfoetens]MCI6153317.1 hypothetical protein [Fusobacterium perfoetens]MDY3237176.1 hypothetical protein [Fusobacterium perfoetens]